MGRDPRKEGKRIICLSDCRCHEATCKPKIRAFFRAFGKGELPQLTIDFLYVTGGRLERGTYLLGVRAVPTWPSQKPSARTCWAFCRWYSVSASLPSLKRRKEGGPMRKDK